LGQTSIVSDLLVGAYAWACEQLYHDYAWTYDAVSWGVSAGAWDAWRQLALEAASGRILELGFGTGELILAARRGQRSIVGLDRSPQMQAVAQRKLHRAGLDAPLVQGSALALPFATGTFDTIVATFPAGYIVDQATLAECARVLAPHGYLVIVGIWIVPQIAGHSVALPLLYRAPGDAALARFVAQIDAAGFKTQIAWRRSQWADVAVVRARRTSTRDATRGPA